MIGVRAFEAMYKAFEINVKIPMQQFTELYYYEITNG